MTNPWPAGVLTALVTPLAGDELDVGALEALIDNQIGAGIAGFVIGGGTGEYGALTIAERLRLAREAIRIVDGRAATVVQSGALATRDCLTLGRDAERAGATGLLIASPFGEPISWAERLRFYEAVTAATELPVMLYNTPPSGLLTVAEIEQLAQLPRVSAIKDSSGDPVLLGDLLTRFAGSGFSVYIGLDSFLYDAIGSGARGAVFGAANVVPGPVSRVARELLNHGQSPQSRQRWQPLREFLRFMENSPNYMALCKAGCALNGIPVGEVRAPYMMPAPEEVDELARRLKEITDQFAATPW